MKSWGHLEVVVEHVVSPRNIILKMILLPMHT
jgi:hypothetical protein